MDSVEFLDLIWDEEHCYVDIPSKTGGHWIPWICEWPHDRVLARDRVAGCVEDGEDVYFSVATFRGRGRRLADALPTRWLWADLDRVDPVFLDSEYLLPTVAWESSPGRYQCVWQLSRTLAPELQSKLNRRLSRALEADPGGWDLTQVLRPVGTKNFKYDPPSDVHLLWYDPEMIYTPAEVRDAVIRIEEEEAIAEAQEDSSVTRRASLRGLPARARRLLRTPPEMVVVGERSARLWELEKLLVEAGLSAGQIFDLVWDSAWNKHREVRSGEERLRKEIDKALASTKRKKATTPRASAPHSSTPLGTGETKGRKARVTSPFVDYATFLSTNIETPRWLIDGIWSASSHGIVGGEPKVSKSTLATAMGLCVATGKPFLNRYAVSNPGPVLMVQEENAPWVVQDRLRKLAKFHGLLDKDDVEVSRAPRGAMVDHVVRLNFPDEAPMHLLNNYGFSLTDGEDLELLENEVRRIGAVMVIIDPLYLVMGDVNLNQSHEVGPLLQWLMALRYNHNCAVVLVHHWSKLTDSSRLRRSGQRLLGSAMFHGWVESALYMEKLEAETGLVRVKVEREFRNVAPQADLEVEWELGEPGELNMDVRVTDWNTEDHLKTVIDRLLAQCDSRGLNVKLVADELGADVLGVENLHSTEARKKAAFLATEAGYNVSKKKYPNGYGYIIYPERNGRKS